MSTGEAGSRAGGGAGWDRAESSSTRCRECEHRTGTLDRAVQPERDPTASPGREHLAGVARQWAKLLPVPAPTLIACPGSPGQFVLVVPYVRAIVPAD